MKLAYYIGLCVREINFYLFKPLLFRLFGLSQPDLILYQPYAGGKQVSIVNSHRRALQVTLQSLLPADLSATVPAQVPISVVQGMLVPVLPAPTFLPVCVFPPSISCSSCLPWSRNLSLCDPAAACQAPLHALLPTTSTTTKRLLL